MDDAGMDGGVGEDGEVLGIPMTLTRSVPRIDLPAGSEDAGHCFSWTLNNEASIWVNKVRFEATLGLHHSNWFFVRETTFPGDDGLWRCRDRSFDSVAAAVSGGVLFAQSTQAAGEEQAFPEGVAIRIPARSVIVGELHVLNTYGEDLDVEATMHLDTIPDHVVTTRLNGLAFDYLDLQLPPRMQSEFTMECDFSIPNAGPIDFGVHYILPHYHELGVGMRVEIIGGARDGDILWEGYNSIGEPLGDVFDPPLDLAGATGMRVTCLYDNPRDEVVRYGIGDQEMCLALLFTDSPWVWGGGNIMFGQGMEVANSDGTSYNEAPCSMVPFRPR
jgi:hypothetical protein